MNHRNCLVAFLAVAGLAAPIASAETVDATNKFAWTENCGWLNWRDANGGTQGAVLHATYLSGFVWGENIGWINLGDGTPVNGVSYANINGTDFGVNRDAVTGELTGFAWGENVGWINFSGGALATPPEPAQVYPGNLRLFGYAWGENIGWVNLDDPTRFVMFVPSCPGDVNGDGMVGLADIAIITSNWTFTVPPAPVAADLDANGSIGLGDIAVVIGNWGAVCP